MTPVVRLDRILYVHRYRERGADLEETVLDLREERGVAPCLEIRPGTVTGILANRSPTIRPTRFYPRLHDVIMGLAAVDRGTVSVFGDSPPLRAETRARIGFVFREGGLLRDYTVWENLQLALCRSLVPATRQREAALDALGAFRAERYREAYPGTTDIGPGATKRINYARALARRPDLLLVDMPFLHVGDRYRDGLRARLRAFVEGGKSLVFTTNDERDLEVLEARSVTIEEGVWVEGDSS